MRAQGWKGGIVSKRGATHRGPKPKNRIPANMRGNRNRHLDVGTKELVDFSLDKLEHMVRVCRNKVAYKNYADVTAKRLSILEKRGCDLSVYECPICGKWHLTSHPWR